MQKSLSSPGICKNKSAEESRDKSPTRWKSRLSNPSMCGDNLKIFVSRNTDESIGTFHLCPRVDPVSVASGLEKTGRRKRASLERETILCFRSLASFSASSLFLVPFCIFCPIRYILSLSPRKFTQSSLLLQRHA